MQLKFILKFTGSLLVFSIRITVVSFDAIIDKITVLHSSREAVDVT